MDKHQVKQIFDDIEVPKKELKKQYIKLSSVLKMKITQGAVLNGDEQLQMESLLLCCGMYTVFNVRSFLPSVNKAMGSIPIVGQIYKEFQDKVGLSLFKSNLVTALNQKLSQGNHCVCKQLLLRCRTACL